MIKISVIVPVYNCEKYIKKCLDSLVNQTLKDIEIIIINDYSTDNTHEIINEYLKKYKKIKYINNDKNIGQGESRNKGIAIAKGTYISFVDGDDYIDVPMLEKLYNKAIENDFDIVCTDGLIETDGKNNIEKKNILNHFEPHKNYIINNSGPVGKIIKLDLIKNNNFYFPKLRAYEDIAVVPLWGIYSKKISFINESMYYYLIHDGSTMKQIEYNDKLTHIYEALDNLFCKLNSKQKIEYKSELEWIYIQHLLHAASLRFYKFSKYDEIKKIIIIIKDKFPNWNKNKYYKKQGLKYKIVCNLIYHKQFKLMKLILK